MNSPISILIVEDEFLVRMDIVDQLQELGFTVFEAINADEALAFLSLHPEIRVVFTDIDMPGSMDGLNLARAVRDRWPPIKIIVTSGHRSVTDLDMPSGSRFFAKPYKAAEVARSATEMVP